MRRSSTLSDNWSHSVSCKVPSQLTCTLQYMQPPLASAFSKTTHSGHKPLPLPWPDSVCCTDCALQAPACGSSDQTYSLARAAPLVLSTALLRRIYRPLLLSTVNCNYIRCFLLCTACGCLPLTLLPCSSVQVCPAGSGSSNVLVSNADAEGSKPVASLQTGTTSLRLVNSLQTDTVSLGLLELPSVGPPAQMCAKPWVGLGLRSYDVGNKVRFLPMVAALGVCFLRLWVL